MSIYNSYVCPRCRRDYPIFIPPSLRINRGLLTPFLRCPHCGQVSRQQIDIKRAVWLWPLIICFFVAVVYCLRMFLPRDARLLSLLVVVVSLLPVFIGYRFGLRLVSVDKSEARRSRARHWLAPTGGIVLCSLSFGYLTGDWANVVVGVFLGLVVWAFFYHRSRGNKRTGSE